MTLSSIPKAITTLLDLERETAELCERVMWLARMDLPTYDEQRLRQVKEVYDRKAHELTERKKELFGR